MSETAEKIAGTFIDDEQVSKPPVLAWLQEALRVGALAHITEEFAKAQTEILNPRRVLVDSVTGDKIQCRLPYAICDHETTTPSRGEILFYVDPAKALAVRLA